MTNSGITSHTGRSKAIDADPISIEIIELRKWIEGQDRAFVSQLRAAIVRGLETPLACWGISATGHPCGNERHKEEQAGRFAILGKTHGWRA
jgi:hypothetical protein